MRSESLARQATELCVVDAQGNTVPRCEGQDAQGNTVSETGVARSVVPDGSSAALTASSAPKNIFQVAITVLGN